MIADHTQAVTAVAIDQSDGTEGEETIINPSRSISEITKAMFRTNMDRLTLNVEERHVGLTETRKPSMTAFLTRALAICSSSDVLLMESSWYAETFALLDAVPLCF